MPTRTPQPSTRTCQYQWCTQGTYQHSEHVSPAIRVPDADGTALYVETDPDTGKAVYGPVLAGDTEHPVGEVRVLAAQLRVAAAQLDELAAWAEAS